MAQQKPWKTFEVTWKTVPEVAQRLHSNCNQQYELWTVGSNQEYSRIINTLWLFNIAMENGPFIVDFPIKNGDFP